MVFVSFEILMYRQLQFISLFHMYVFSAVFYSGLYALCCGIMPLFFTSESIITKILENEWGFLQM